MDAPQQRRFAAYTYYKLLSEPKRCYSASDILVAHHVWSGGYHHWVADVLVSLNELGDTSGLHLLIPGDYPSFAFASLEAFHFREMIRLPSRTGAFVRGAIVVGHQHTANFHPNQLKRLRERLLSHAHSTAPRTSQQVHRLYVSRQDAGVRRVANERELIALLCRHGFQVVLAEQMSFWQQAVVFAQCEMLVANHGGGLTNMLFMKSGGRVVEIIRAPTSEAPHLTNCYRNMAEALGLDHTHVYSQAVPDRRLSVGRQDTVADLSAVEEAILEALPSRSHESH